MNHVEKYYTEWADEITPKGWLEYLHNTYGTFKLAIAHKQEDGTATWTKWRDYKECHDDTQFITTANNRTILPCELVIDLESTEALPKATSFLNENNILNYAVFRTGSRGYHIHLIHPLFQQENPVAKILKEKMLRETGGELLKASSNVMIALEFRPHWKTGKKKEYCENGR